MGRGKWGGWGGGLQPRSQDLTQSEGKGPGKEVVAAFLRRIEISLE